MQKVITTKQAAKLSENLHQSGKTVVLAGGCFDIVHGGHLEFLRRAKKKGDVLLVLLESDKAIKKYKGNARPVNSQKDRAGILSSLEFVDYVIPLPYLKNDLEYDALVFTLKPDIIATTAGDTARNHKERQARSIHAQVVDVMKRLPDQSTSRLVHLLN